MPENREGKRVPDVTFRTREVKAYASRMLPKLKEHEAAAKALPKA